MRTDGRALGTSRKTGRIGPLPITEARARLYQLVEDVLTRKASLIELSHRDHDEHVVLIRKAEVERMEADLRALRARVEPAPRPLRGLGRLHVRPEQILTRTRQRAHELADANRRALGGSPES